MSFYQSGQPIIIPDPQQGAVNTVTAGSNVYLTGTSNNPIINAVGTVASIIAGSNITVSGTSNITINSSGGGGGSSSSNISHFGFKQINSTELDVNDFVQLFSIDPTYFSNSNSSYLLTVDWSIPTATCSNVSGNVGVVVNYGLANLTKGNIVLINQSTWGNTSNLNYSANMASTFIPDQGTDELNFFMVNNTGGTITTGQIEFVISITGLTTSNINANTWPPP
jgi:hypothetical protein